MASALRLSAHGYGPGAIWCPDDRHAGRDASGHHTTADHCTRADGHVRGDYGSWMTRNGEHRTFSGQLGGQPVALEVVSHGHHDCVMRYKGPVGQAAQNRIVKQALACEARLVIQIPCHCQFCTGISHSEEDVGDDLPVSASAQYEYAHTTVRHAETLRIRFPSHGIRPLWRAPETKYPRARESSRESARGSSDPTSRPRGLRTTRRV